MPLFPYTVIDLTHTVEKDSPSWEGTCGFTIQSSECLFTVQTIQMSAGIGTHIDAPAHYVKGALSVDQLPLSRLIAPCVVVTPAVKCDERYLLLPEDIGYFEQINGTIEPGSLVLINTGWAKRWNAAESYRNNLQFPSISKEAAELLLRRDVCGLGIDTLSPDTAKSDFPVHKLFLTAGKYIIENVASLEKVPSKGSFALALPFKAQEATEAPLRLVALIDHRP